MFKRKPFNICAAIFCISAWLGSSLGCRKQETNGKFKDLAINADSKTAPLILHV